MKKVTQIFISVILIIMIGGCNLPWQEDKQNAQSPKKKQLPTVQVGVMVAKKQDIPVSFEFPAKITSTQDVNIVAKVPGTLLKQYFKAGDMVKTGDKLFLIDPDKYEAAYDSANAAIGVAKATLNQAALDFKRVKNLKANNSISQKEYDEAVANYQISKAKLESAQANLKNAQIDLDYTVIKAPFDGILGDAYKDVGAYINLSDANLVRLTKLDPIYAEFAISEVDALNINQKLQSKQWLQKGSFASLNIKDKDYNGTVIFIDKIINNKTGSVDAKAEFDNTSGEILPGSFARISMSGFYQKDGFKVPQVVVQQDASTTFVYIVKNGKVAKSTVKIVYEDAQYAVISQGLKEGDKIITDNFGKIGVGAPVSEILIDSKDINNSAAKTAEKN